MLNQFSICFQYVPKIFSPAYADFPKLSKDVFVSKIAHRAEIENSEEGTTASAVTSKLTIDIESTYINIISRLFRN